MGIAKWRRGDNVNRGSPDIALDRVLRRTTHKETVHAVARRMFEVGDVTSCCAPTKRRGSEEELYAGESLDDVHGSTTDGALA